MYSYLGQIQSYLVILVILRTNAYILGQTQSQIMSNPVIFMINSVISRTNLFLFRKNPVILRTNPKILRTNPIMIWTNPVISTRKPVILFAIIKSYSEQIQSCLGQQSHTESRKVRIWIIEKYTYLGQIQSYLGPI